MTIDIKVGDKVLLRQAMNIAGTCEAVVDYIDGFDIYVHAMRAGTKIPAHRLRNEIVKVITSDVSNS